MIKPNSLRTKLIAWTLVPSLFLWVFASIFIYNTAVRSASASYDYILTSLIETLSVRVYIRDGKQDVDFPTEVIPILREQHVDKRFYQISGSDGHLIAGDVNLPPPPAYPSVTTLFHGSINGVPIRIAARRVRLPHSDKFVDIQIAETMHGRNEIAKDAIKRLSAAGVAIFIVIMLKTFITARQVLAPLAKVQNQVSMATMNNAGSIDDISVPMEIRPLVLEIKNLLQRLNAEHKQQKRFVSDAAHQLRTPLAGIKIHSELAKRNDPREASSAHLNQITVSVTQATNMVNKMLTLATSESSALSRDAFTLCDLGAIVYEVTTSFVPLALQTEIDLGVGEVSKDAMVLGQEWALRELISNLVDNAIKYTPERGHITVKLLKESQRTVLEVEDSGPGIPHEERSRVFERFYRLSNAPKGGSGLGLSIVGEVARTHNAEVEILDPQFGSGCLFRVTFPTVDNCFLAPKSKEGGQFLSLNVN